MLEPQVNSVPTTCPLGMLSGGPHTIAASRHEACVAVALFFLPLLESVIMCRPSYATLPLQRGLVPFQVRSLVQMRVEARSASIVNPGEHWKVTVWL